MEQGNLLPEECPISVGKTWEQYRLLDEPGQSSNDQSIRLQNSIATLRLLHIELQDFI